MAQSRRALKHHWKSNEIKNIFNKSPLRESSKYAKEEHFAQSLGWQYRQAPHKNFIQKIALQREQQITQSISLAEWDLQVPLLHGPSLPFLLTALNLSKRVLNKFFTFGSGLQRLIHYTTYTVFIWHVIIHNKIKRSLPALK